MSVRKRAQCRQAFGGGQGLGWAAGGELFSATGTLPPELCAALGRGGKRLAPWFSAFWVGMGGPDPCTHRAGLGTAPQQRWSVVLAQDGGEWRSPPRSRAIPLPL